MKPLHRLPLDDWFDDVPHPYDTWPMATNNTDENPRPEEEVAENITMHERMYREATKKHSPWPGGSEEWQDSKPG